MLQSLFHFGCALCGSSVTSVNDVVALAFNKSSAGGSPVLMIRCSCLKVSIQFLGLLHRMTEGMGVSVPPCSQQVPTAGGSGMCPGRCEHLHGWSPQPPWAADCPRSQKALSCFDGFPCIPVCVLSFLRFAAFQNCASCKPVCVLLTSKSHTLLCRLLRYLLRKIVFFIVIFGMRKKQACIIFNNIFNRLRKIEAKKGSSGAKLIEQCAVFLTVSSCKSSLCVLEMGLDLSWIMLQNKICYCNVKSTAVL